MDYKATAYASFDGIKLSGYLWESKTKPLAIINLVHGWGEYSERFNNWAKHFNEKGYLVHAIDYRGHGKSDGRRGYIRNFDEFLDDIEVLLKESAKAGPQLPQVLYGHSLGGNIVANYILKRKNNLKAAVISSPWFKLSFDPSPLKLLLAKIIRKVYPKFTQKAKLDINALTHDTEVIEKYLDDPLVHGKMSARMFYEIYQAGRWVLGHPEKLNLPVLIQHGNEDKITWYKASKEFADKARDLNKDVTWKEWDGMYHELHNETAAEDVFKFIVEWVEKKL